MGKATKAVLVEAAILPSPMPFLILAPWREVFNSLYRLARPYWLEPLLEEAAGSAEGLDEGAARKACIESLGPR